mgnify:CR=1 FL=1
MNLEEQIYVRKSCRNYLDDEIDMDLIREFISSVKPLNSDINYYYEILTKDEVNLRTRWHAPYYLALYSEKKEEYLENIGFVFQQVSLFMQSIDIGSCWVGLGSIKKKNPEFVILIAFGKSDKMTRNLDDFKRKGLDEISDGVDDRLTPARLAPSAVNSQPWYFKHSSDGFDVYQRKQNIVKRQFLKKWNPIDVGIALAHMYVANEKTFEEEYGIKPLNHPWLKPVRKNQEKYEFFEMKGEEVHQVAVGPIHAGVIEPGHFRFMCHGEKVYDLEIMLGYQNRGVEDILLKGSCYNNLGTYISDEVYTDGFTNLIISSIYN